MKRPRGTVAVEGYFTRSSFGCEKENGEGNGFDPRLINLNIQNSFWKTFSMNSVKCLIKLTAACYLMGINEIIALY